MTTLNYTTQLRSDVTWAVLRQHGATAPLLGAISFIHPEQARFTFGVLTFLIADCAKPIDVRHTSAVFRLLAVIDHGRAATTLALDRWCIFGAGAVLARSSQVFCLPRAADCGE